MEEEGESSPWLLVMQSVPVVVGYKFLLFSLNEHLSRTAVVVQPLVIPAGASPGDPRSLPLFSLIPEFTPGTESSWYISPLFHGRFSRCRCSCWFSQPRMSCILAVDWLHKRTGCNAAKPFPSEWHSSTRPWIQVWIYTVLRLEEHETQFSFCADDLPMVDVALPLSHSEDLSQTTGFDPRSGEKSSLTLPRGVEDAVQAMGLSHSIGSVRLLQARPGSSPQATSPCSELSPPSSLQTPSKAVLSMYCPYMLSPGLVESVSHDSLHCRC